jgi:hypothetical protein
MAVRGCQWIFSTFWWPRSQSAQPFIHNSTNSGGLWLRLGSICTSKYGTVAPQQLRHMCMCVYVYIQYMDAIYCSRLVSNSGSKAKLIITLYLTA